MLHSLKKILTPTRPQVQQAYLHIVEQARLPVFYRDWQVEDTFDGRFDMIALHLALVLIRLEAEASGETAQFHRALQEWFFSDMDRCLREMGAGDTGVGMRVKNIAQAFYGRLTAYRQPSDDEAALRHNVWRDKPVADEAVEALAAYLRHRRAALSAQPASAIMQGDNPFDQRGPGGIA